MTLTWLILGSFLQLLFAYFGFMIGAFSSNENFMKKFPIFCIAIAVLGIIAYFFDVNPIVYWLWAAPPLCIVGFFIKT